MPDPLGGFSYGAPYPYDTGYAQISDVQARIMGGTWDPANDPAAYPSPTMVNTWLQDATAHLDAALVTRGYWVPLKPNPSWANPTGLPLLQGIAIQAWLILRNIAAAYATHFVEASRHGGVGDANEDPNAAHWMTIFDDFCTRLESGADSLVPFGVGGPFPPEPDPAQALSTGSLGMVLSDASLSEGPLFTKSENLGGGWEGGGAVNPALPSGPPFSG